MFDLSELPRPVIRYGAGLWRRRWLVVAIAWLTAILGWIAVAMIPDRYQSQAAILISEPLVDPLISEVASRPDISQRVQVLRLSLLTFPNVEEIVYRAGLDSEIIAITPLDRQAQLERMVKEIQNNISIVNPRTNYFEFRYAHQNPQIAKDVVDAAVNLLIEQDLGESLRQTEATEDRLRTKIAEYDGLLAKQEQEVVQYRRIHATELAATIGDKQQSARKEAQLENIIDNISQTSLRVETLRVRLASTPKLSTGGELEGLKIRLAQLRSQYNDNYPDIQNLLQQIERLESDEALPDNRDYIRIQSELRSARDTLAALRIREERIRAEIESDFVTVGQSPEIAAGLLQLQRRVEETRNYLSTLVTYRDSLAQRRTISDGSRGLDYSVLERPRKALVPNDPPRQLLILAVSILAFGAGGALALAMTFLDKTYTQSADLEAAFDLPIMGAIGTIKTPLSKKKVRRDFLQLSTACVALFLLCFVYIYVAVLHPQASVLKSSEEVTASAAEDYKRRLQ